MHWMHRAHAHSQAAAAFTSAFTAVTPGNGAWGSWTELVAATTSDAYGFLANSTGYSVAAASIHWQIGIGAASSEVVLAEWLSRTFTSTGYETGACYFPIYIPAGERVSVRGWLGSSTITAANVAVSGIGQSSAMMGSYAGMDLLGVSSGAGTTVVAAASAHNKGSWTEIIASTARNYSGLDLHMHQITSGAFYTLADIALGAGGSEVILFENLMLRQNSAVHISPGQRVVMPCDIPAGTRISMRMQAGTSTNHAYALGAYY